MLLLSRKQLLASITFLQFLRKQSHFHVYCSEMYVSCHVSAPLKRRLKVVICPLVLGVILVIVLHFDDVLVYKYNLKANMPRWPRLSKNYNLFQHPLKLNAQLLLHFSFWLEAVTRRHNKGMDWGMRRRRKPSQRIRKMSEWYNLVACFCAC